MTDKPEIVSSETIYKGSIFDVRVDQVRSNGRVHKRELAVHRGSVVVMPVYEDGRVALVRQFRLPAGKQLLELAAGGIDGDETPAEAAARELKEEIGLKASNLELMAEFYSSPGFLTEKMHLFLATGLSEVGQELEEDEELEIERYSFPQLFEMIRDREIEDGKTIVGTYMAAERLSLQKPPD